LLGSKHFSITEDSIPHLMIETVNFKQSVGAFIRGITLTDNSYRHNREIKSCSKHFIYLKNVADDLDGFTLLVCYFF